MTDRGFEGFGSDPKNNRHEDGRAVRIKLCGLTQDRDIEWANELMPEYIGFVLWDKSKRALSSHRARELKRILSKDIAAVGVFVDERPRTVASLLEEGVIDIAQLHGSEDEAYIKSLRAMTDRPLIKAFKIACAEDVKRAEASSADHILLDSGAGGGALFDHTLLSETTRPFFLAGGLDATNVAQAVRALSPFAVDASSGLETDGKKDPVKMRAFVEAVRNHMSA